MPLTAQTKLKMPLLSHNDRIKISIVLMQRHRLPTTERRSIARGKRQLLEGHQKIALLSFETKAHKFYNATPMTMTTTKGE